ncbi:S8 family serine peptidase [Microbacterium aoyamense]|uniref:S8 family serine peptidase n=2 Tax=Microbacterium aoyamense TaxID=344166 RepID=A0ABN2PR31_9MICO
MTLVVGSAFVGSAASATSSPPDLPPAVDASQLDARATAKLGGAITAAEGKVTAFVELATDSGVEVEQAGGDAAAVQDAAAETEAVAAEVVPSSADANARSRSDAPARVSVVTNLISGTIVTGDAAQVRSLADDPAVVRVSLVRTHTVDNANSVAFTRALETWQSTGQTGEGVRIGIVDTGIDYTHADFGGGGTVEAYDAAYGEDGTQPIPEGSFDATKFLGGHDFAGPTYDAELADSVPMPDDNPIDSPFTTANSGHGSHVAGSAAGFGVLPDGTTFRGEYSALKSVADWQVGPGTAPGAGLYALKVFGDAGGSTNLVIPALDWASDPNGDGDFSDRLDIVNMSLGSDYGPADDPENAVVDRLSKLGTLVVNSAGNAGDLTDVGGSPGNSASALTVANSVGGPQTYDGIEVTAASDSNLVGLHAGQNSVSYVGDDVTAPVAFVGADFDGCTAFTPDQAAAVAGKIAYLWWEDDDAARVCGSVVRFNNATAAGAVGVLLPTEQSVFAAGISGNAAIPGAQMTSSTTDALLPEIEAGTLTVHIGPGLASAVVADITPDVLNTGSSRGEHGSLGIVKPDVAAPGTGILSAASGSGSEPHALSGTSMASPHVAGIAALVREANPGWDSWQIKAAVVNTATHDLYTGAGRTGLTYGPERVGSGRVDALDAVTNRTIAYDSENPALTSVAFGVVDVGDTTVVQKRTVTVKNLGSTSQRYSTSVSSASTAGGASITASPESITIPAGGQALVTLTLTADPATLSRDMDPTSVEFQAGVPRDYMTEVSGRLVLTSGEAELRVPVRAAPRLVTDLTAQDVAFASAGAETAELAVEGRGVASGGWFGLTSPFILAATSPKLEADASAGTSAATVGSGDLRYVGWASTAPSADPSSDGYLGVGIAVDSDWSNLGTVMIPVIDIDLDGDGAFDIETYVQKLQDTDITLATTVDLNSGDVVGLEHVNEFFGNVETGVFDRNVAVIPIPLGSSGMTEGVKPTLSVWTFSGLTGDMIDAVDPFTVDPFAPPVWFENNAGDFSSVLDGGESVTVHRGTGALPEQLLVLQHHNADAGARAQVVDLTSPAATATTTTLKVTGGKTVGKDATLTATVKPKAAAGTVSFLDGTTEIASAAVENGKATATAKLGAGTHSLTAVFTPDSAEYASSTSEAVVVETAQSTSKTTVTLSPSSVSFGTSSTAKVTVTGKTAAPSGKVELREGKTVLATADLTVTGLTGTASVALPNTLGKGSHTITAVYLGSADVAGSKAEATLKVKAATATVTMSAPSWKVKPGAPTQIGVAVTGPSGAPAPTGTVTVSVNFRVVAKVAASSTPVSVTVPGQRFFAVVTAVYSGDAGYSTAIDVGVLTVR